MGTCQGRCSDYASEIQSRNLGYSDRKRCNECQVFLPNIHEICPCCGGKLQTKPHY